MPFLVLSLQDGSNPELLAATPRGLMFNGQSALDIARCVPNARYREHVRAVFIFELQFNSGWDPGDFRDDSPFIVYRAMRDGEGNWTEKISEFDLTSKEG